MTEQPLLVEDRGGVRFLWFNRPSVHNAQNVVMLEQLERALVETAGLAWVRAVVLGGKGPSFCSGHDLAEMAANARYAADAATAEGRYRQELRLFVRPVELLTGLPVPTVCRLQGHCLAAGLMFVAACDLVVAADDAELGSPVIPAMGVADAELPALAWLIGERRAKQALWLDERISADEALGLGLVNWVVPVEELDAKVDDVVARLTRAPADAVALSKASFRFLAQRRGRDDFFAYHYLAHQLSHHTTEAVRRLEERVGRVRAGGSPVSGVVTSSTDTLTEGEE